VFRDCLKISKILTKKAVFKQSLSLFFRVKTPFFRFAAKDD